MSKQTWDRLQTRGEEVANSISHGVGFVAAAAAAPLLVLKALPKGAWGIVGVAIFSLTMLLLYLSSTLYHAFPHSRVKRVFRVFDHSSIFLLIAGTYTPFTLLVLPPAWGWTLFGLVWALAVFGIVLKSVQPVKSSRLSTILYIGMGWLAVVAVKPLVTHLPLAGLLWLLLGGAFYSLGIIFFATDHRVRYHHFVWHLFVLAGTACHVVTIWKFVL
jgi:hemolysin III